MSVGSSRRRDALIVIVALVVGMGSVAAFTAVTGSADAEASATIDADFDLDAAPVPLAERGATVPAGTPAPSPAVAVERFLEAEAAGAFEASYALLSQVQRAEYTSPASWASAHADFFPVVGFQILESDGTSVTTEVSYRSSLDEVVGLVPSRARVVWQVLEEDGGWLVDFDASAVEPLFPDDGAADEAVAEWARAHQDCSEPEQYAGALVATADLRRAVETLCDSATPFATGAVGTLDEFDARGLVSAFGTAALSWARTVELDGPVELTVVVAPIDDRWVVVGLLPPE